MQVHFDLCAQQAFHPRQQVRFRSFQHRVVLIGHQTIRLHLRVGLLAGFRQRLDEVLPVHVVQGNLLSAIPPAHKVILGPRILDAELARRSEMLKPCCNEYQFPNGPSYQLINMKGC